MIKGYEKELSTTDAKISLEGMDPHLFRTDSDFYIDHMLKNKDQKYEQRKEQFLTRDLQPHDRIEE